MQFKGSIKKIGETITGQSEKGTWSKTSILIEEIDTQYPNSLVFDDMKDKIGNLKPGMVVIVDYNCRAKEVNGKIFNSLSIWKIEAVAAKNSNTPTSNSNTPDDLPY